MQLQLQPGGQTIREHPFGKDARLEDAVDGRQQNGRGARAERVPIDDALRELVVAAVLNDELDFVVPRQPAEVLPIVLVGFAAGGTLDVDDFENRRRHPRNGPMAAGLEHDAPARGQQTVHQRIHLVLQQRLAAGNLDERAAMPIDLGHHLVHRHLAPFVERVRRVAPGTAEVARRQPHEHAGLAGARRFALDGVEDLVDGEQFSTLDLSLETCRLISIILR